MLAYSWVDSQGSAEKPSPVHDNQDTWKNSAASDTASDATYSDTKITRSSPTRSSTADAS